MDSLERIAGVEAPVDEDVVLAEVEGYVRGWSVEAPRPWRIETAGQADWAMRRLAETQAHRNEYQQEIVRWKSALEKMVRAGEWFEMRLKEWGIRQRTPSRKTLTTAHGTVATREQKARIEVIDEDEAVAWAAKACPDAVKTTQELLVSKIGDAARILEVIVAFEATMKDTGEMQRLPVEPVLFTDEAVAAVQERIGAGFHVKAITELQVWSDDGPVPGLGVRPGQVTATVNPLGL